MANPSAERSAYLVELGCTLEKMKKSGCN